MHTRSVRSLVVVPAFSFAPLSVKPAPERSLPAHLAFLRERLRPISARTGALSFGDARVDGCFPFQEGQRGLPLGALHEIGTEGRGAETEELPAAFAAALIGGICVDLRGRAPVLWVATMPDLYPPGLKGLDPARLVMVNPRDESGVLAAMEIALREGGFAAVVGEVGQLGRVASRRLVFACQKHGVTAFVLRRWPHGNRTPDRQVSAAATRWLVAPAPAGRWRVDLTHARGGQTGSWLMEAEDGKAHSVRVVVT